MEALIVVLVLHCGVPEHITLVDPTRNEFNSTVISKSNRDAAVALFRTLKAQGARASEQKVEQVTGEKCPVST